MEPAVEQTTTAAVAGGVDYDHGDGAPTNIAKGKRTKRQRPQSPILFIYPSTNNNDDLYYSPVSSSGFPAGSTTTEDEDTAESLILLSKGHPLDLSTSRKNYRDDYDGMFKFNSKRYIRSPATGNAGVIVYECKTCSRTFPSFQALGGHRASHKKPKNNEDMRKPPPYTVVTEPPEFQFGNHISSSSSSFSIQFNNLVSLTGNTNKLLSKLHECSICGTEFNSGQALGGHMRRHRVAGGGNKGGNNNGTTNNNTNSTTLSLTPFSPVTTVAVYDRKSKNDALCLGLGLDLNLPAPREATADDDDQRQKRSFGFSSTGENEKKQPPAVPLSAAPTLMDCHH